MITTPEKEQKNTGFYNNDNEMSGLTASHLNNLCYILKIIYFKFPEFKQVEVYFLSFTYVKYNRNLNTINK